MMSLKGKPVVLVSLPVELAGLHSSDVERSPFRLSRCGGNLQMFLLHESISCLDKSAKGELHGYRGMFSNGSPCR
jgi:hypothetical protein